MLQLIEIINEAYCTLVITLEELYPSGRGKSIAGEASPEDKLGVFTFAHKDPHFPLKKEALSREEHGLLLLRSFKVIIHELIHMFNLKHCIYYDCVMNGVANRQESDRQPSILCPVDLHKFKYLLGDQFDIERHYFSLYVAYKKLVGFEKEANWILQRLQSVLKNNFTSRFQEFIPTFDIDTEITEMDRIVTQSMANKQEINPTGEFNAQPQYKLEAKIRPSVVLNVALKSSPEQQKAILIVRRDFNDLFLQAQKKLRLKKLPTQAFHISDPSQPLSPDSLLSIPDGSLILF